jgi:5'-methylthioadenosine phosphorylase
MTNMPEAKLAREAEMCYATVAMVTDFDSWHPDHDNVDVASVIATLKGNGNKAAEFIKRLASVVNNPAGACPHGCDTALDFAIMTATDKRDPALVAKLQTVAGRALG